MRPCIFLFLVLALLLNVRVGAQPQAMDSLDGLLEMLVGKLMEVKITSLVTLRPTTAKRILSTVTVISVEQIRRSSARNLCKWLNIYIPNFQRLFHSAKLRHMGLRGINDNHGDKSLLPVKGRVLNEETDFGSMSERDLPMLVDIHPIDVVRGLELVLCGAEGLAMMIDIVTNSAKTFHVAKVSRLYAIEDFYSDEIRYCRKHDRDGDVFLYANTADYPGAVTKYAPVAPDEDITISNESFPADVEVEYWFRPLNETFRDMPKYKMHGCCL